MTESPGVTTAAKENWIKKNYLLRNLSIKKCLKKRASESMNASTLKIGKNCKALRKEPKDDLDKWIETFHVQRLEDLIWSRCQLSN